MRLPLKRVEGFAVGDVLPLPGVTVGSLRLEGPDDAPVAPARLGQVMGLRAVRLELARPSELREVELVDPGAATGPAPLSDDPGPARIAPAEAPASQP